MKCLFLILCLQISSVSLAAQPRYISNTECGKVITLSGGSWKGTRLKKQASAELYRKIKYAKQSCEINSNYKLRQLGEEKWFRRHGGKHRVKASFACCIN